jgi:hypothetical protein
MRSHLFVTSVILALGTSACIKVEYHHGSVSAAEASPGTVGFGLGVTTTSTRSILLGRSESEATRVEHAAATTRDGTRDRFWRTVVASNAPDVLLGFQQKLELCEGTPTTPGPCVDATFADSRLPVLGMPTILEGGNLGQSASFSATTTQGGTFVTSQGHIVAPWSRGATEHFGVWVALGPTSGGALFTLGSATGTLAFCTAPEGVMPLCTLLPSGSPPPSRVLAVHLVRRSGVLKHVLWYQPLSLATYTTRARPTSTVVRCEADDSQPLPQCQSTEVEP